jgi:hypothetical protein
MFTDDFMHFKLHGELHTKEIGDDLAHQGFPDDGNGIYAQTQGYPAWYFFNITKRIHRNDFEHLVTLIPLSLVNGFFFPKVTIALLGVYYTGRYFYTVGY